MLGTEEMRAPDGGDDDIRAARHLGEVACARVGDCHGGVSARSAFHKQESHGFSNNHAASNHDRTLAGGLDASLLKQPDAPKRRAGHKTRWIFHRKLGDIHRMEPIHILARIDRQNDLRLVDLRRRRGLDKNAVNSRIRIEFGNEGQKRRLTCVGGKLVFHGMQAKLGSFAILRAHIGAGCGIIAYKHHGKSWPDTALRQGRNARLCFFHHLCGDRRSINPLHVLKDPPDFCVSLRIPPPSIQREWPKPRRS